MNQRQNRRLAIYSIIPARDERDKPMWRRCGVAFENADGSINVKLDLLPTTDLQIREVVEQDRDQQSRNQQNQGAGRNDRRGSRR